MVPKFLVFSTAALAIAAGSPAAAAPSSSRATCMLLSDLVLMQYQMRQFQDMLKTGTDTGEARRLHHWLDDHPQVDLRIRMRRAGLQNFESATLDLITRHKGLLAIHSSYGPGEAEAQAKRLGTDARLQSYSARILPLPCDFAPLEDSAGGALSGLGQLKRLPQEAVITGSLLTLILGTAAGILAQRLARRRLRLSRRYPCALACRLDCGNHRFEARIVDISRLGAKVRVGLEHGQPVPLIKGEVTVSVDGVPPVEAQTIRQDHIYVGIKFSSRLARAELNRLLNRNAAQPVEPQTAVSPA